MPRVDVETGLILQLTCVHTADRTRGNEAPVVQRGFSS